MTDITKNRICPECGKEDELFECRCCGQYLCCRCNSSEYIYDDMPDMQPE